MCGPRENGVPETRTPREMDLVKRRSRREPTRGVFTVEEIFREGLMG